MFESKYSKLLTILLIIGIIVIIGVLLFLGISVIHSNNINNEAEGMVDKFKNEINNPVYDEENNEMITNGIDPIIGIENIVTDGNSSNDNLKTYKGFPVVGTIEIPAIKLESLVLQDASKKAMEVAVGIYDGPGLNKIGNTTIAGHNYRNRNIFL